MPNNIEKLRELMAAGTQGRVANNSHFECLHTHSTLAKLHPVVHYSHNNPNMENDARLIEAALNLLPALLAVAEAAVGLRGIHFGDRDEEEQALIVAVAELEAVKL